MKKIFSILVFTFLITGFSYAQYYKPNMQLIVKGVGNIPFYDAVSDNTSNGVFGGFQVEPVVNVSPHWGIFGTFNIGFIPSRDGILTTGTGTIDYKHSTELSGYVGPRYYFAPEDGRYIKVYVDLGVGYYKFNISDAVFTASSTPTYTKTFTFPSNSQIGANVGAGLNVNLNPSVFLNFGARLHNLFSKSNQEQSYKVIYSNGTTTEETIIIKDIPNQNYLQITAGLGFRFGL